MKKKKCLLAFVLLTILSSLCLVFLFSKNKDLKVSGYDYDQVTINFIHTIGEDAKAIADAYGLYPSVMIAQAVLESQSGQPSLSANYNNLFGIKGAYNGASVTMQTWEDDGEGNAYTIDAAFRSYPSVSESLEDYAVLLTSSSYYTDTWRVNTASYQDATAALTGTYATDTQYGEKLNMLIEYYGLTVYDNLS
ncbi:glucosaminidase domain-containing protein [Streptococcus sp. SGI.013]|uniref:glucosaminidase domain-containing protein n=1 Tax=unclassified Streptococcus TaxID=2608887 RepID=UPI003D0087CC